ncbi:MAG: amidohydrolase, partial [Pyramidobacter sp.]|nr:amidohydrolase [Pyramidobacter sp.]
MSASLMSEARELQGYLTDLRRELHRVPEIGTNTPRTMKIIMRELDKIGISYTYFEDCSGIVATIGHGGKCFLLRADCDALPVTDESGVEFCATGPGGL